MNILFNIMFYEKDGSGQVVTFISGQVVTPLDHATQSLQIKLLMQIHQEGGSTFSNRFEHVTYNIT